MSRASFLKVVDGKRASEGGREMGRKGTREAVSTDVLSVHSTSSVILSPYSGDVNQHVDPSATDLLENTLNSAQSQERAT